MASEAGQGAVEGAAAGMAAGPWGALIGAATGAIGGFIKGNQAKKEAERKKKALARARTLATPGHLAEVVSTLQPLMRNIIDSGLGPQFKGEIDRMLASHGLTGTGAGEAIRSSAQAAPTLFATQRATEEAGSVVQREVGVALSEAGEDISTGNPLMEALLGGARGYISGGGTFGKQKATAGGAEGTIMPSGAAVPAKKDPYDPTDSGRP